MSALRIEEKKDSPEIVLDKEANNFYIKGRSFPEDSQTFYVPVISWFDTLTENINIDLKIDLMYISSASTIAIRRLMKKLEELKIKGFTISIKWYFEEGDDDIKLSGERYKDTCSLDFEITEYKPQH